jgi:hypothetical protein
VQQNTNKAQLLASLLAHSALECNITIVQLTTLMLFSIIFLVCLGFECLQQWSSYKESLHVKSMPIEELTSLTPSNVITYRSCLAPIDTTNKVDNSRKFESVEKDEGSISKPETHAMPPVRVINKGHLVKRCCLYMHGGSLHDQIAWVSKIYQHYL